MRIGIVVCVWLVGAFTSAGISYVYVQSESAPRVAAENLIARDHNSVVCAFRKFVPPKSPHAAEFLAYLVTIPPDFTCAPLLAELLLAKKP